MTLEKSFSWGKLGKLLQLLGCSTEVWICTRSFSAVNLRRLESPQKFTHFQFFFLLPQRAAFLAAYDALVCSDYNDITYPLVLDVRCWHWRAGWAWFTGACGPGCCLSLQLVCYYKALRVFRWPHMVPKVIWSCLTVAGVLVWNEKWNDLFVPGMGLFFLSWLMSKTIIFQAEIFMSLNDAKIYSVVFFIRVDRWMG